MDYKDALSQIIELQKSKSNVSPYLGEWIEWFQGYVPSYHKYYVYNGKKKNYKRMLSMKMAKQSCEDWASLLMNEKVQIVVADQDKLDDLLIDLDFYNKANEAVEKGFALSMCALVINVDGIEANQNEKGELVITSLNKAKLKLSNCSANHLYPLNWENGTCTECGQMLMDDDIYNGNTFEGVAWFCDNCGALLNRQDGFTDSYGSWRCTECGYVNGTTEDDIIDGLKCPRCGALLETQSCFNKYDDDKFEYSHEERGEQEKYDKTLYDTIVGAINHYLPKIYGEARQ